jgi:protein SCO1
MNYRINCFSPGSNLRAATIIRRTFSRIAMALIFGALAVFGCNSNTAPILPAPPQSSSNGSFKANNTADCLPEIHLVDQHGATVSLAALKGKPVLIDFIYTTCASACPLLTARFAQVADKLGGELGSGITMVSITIDPERDHPAQLLEYAKTHSANRGGWLLLTGKPADVESVLAIYGLKRHRESDGTIDHVTTSYLLGRDGKQIRMYDTLEVAPATVVGDVNHVLAHG